MSDRPGWMPSDDEIGQTLGLGVRINVSMDDAPVRRLIERAALKAQIEALLEWGEHRHILHKQWDRGRFSSCPLCRHIEQLRARLAELEGR